MRNSHIIQLRHASFYLNLLRGHEAHYAVRAEDRSAAIRALAADWTNIEIAQKRCQKLVGKDDEATAFCCDYPTAGARLLDSVMHPRERIRWRQAALKAAEALKFRAGLSAHFGNLGLAYLDLGEPRRAIKLLKKALTLAREFGDSEGESTELGNLGVAYFELGQASRALKLYEQALGIAREIG